MERFYLLAILPLISYWNPIFVLPLPVRQAWSFRSFVFCSDSSALFTTFHFTATNRDDIAYTLQQSHRDVVHRRPAHFNNEGGRNVPASGTQNVYSISTLPFINNTISFRQVDEFRQALGC